MELDNAFFNLYFRHYELHALVNETNEVHVFLHGEQTPVVESGEDWTRPGLVKPHPHVVLRSGDWVDFSVSLQLEASPSLRRRPCEEDRRYNQSHCRQQCVRRLQAEIIGC